MHSQVVNKIGAILRNDVNTQQTKNIYMTFCFFKDFIADNHH